MAGLLIYFFSVLLNIFLNCVKNAIGVTVAAIISLTGSAWNTPNTFSAKKFGKMKINGINKIILCRHARKRQILACPNAMKLCWQLNWKPVENIPVFN